MHVCKVLRSSCSRRGHGVVATNKLVAMQYPRTHAMPCVCIYIYRNTFYTCMFISYPIYRNMFAVAAEGEYYTRKKIYSVIFTLAQHPVRFVPVFRFVLPSYL